VRVRVRVQFTIKLSPLF